MFWSKWCGSKTPSYLTGSWEIGDVIIIKYRLFIIVVGFIIFSVFQYMLKKTKIGLIVRAGVQDKEMAQALGIHIKRVFLYVLWLVRHSQHLVAC